MPLFAFGRQPVSGFGKKYGSVGPGVHVSGLSQPGEGPIDGDVGHPQPARQIHHARFAQRRGKVGDGLDVILGRFRRGVAALPA